ncbi:MAG TPA: hydroxyisourate hydrolase [Azospirillaceae bacterium]|nr:hydroxyisourate hydrolase [Azospirillaceae bacterium]
MASLTAQIFDTQHGRPAEGVEVEVFALGPNDAVHPIRVAATGADGRADRPLLHDGELEKGDYELHLHLGPYFRAAGVVEAEPRFLNIVSVRIGVADPDADIHVTVAVSPWSYTVFRA